MSKSICLNAYRDALREFFASAEYRALRFYRAGYGQGGNLMFDWATVEEQRLAEAASAVWASIAASYGLPADCLDT